MCNLKFHVLSNQSKILNEQREVIESLHRIPVDIVNENPHQLVSDWDMLAFLNVITRYGWPCQIGIKYNRIILSVELFYRKIDSVNLFSVSVLGLHGCTIFEICTARPTKLNELERKLFHVLKIISKSAIFLYHMRDIICRI